ncbi:MAG: hypothetical protein HYU44_20145 [Betaproteobacteria bacterium]|nr:hypothetical protein [Betaproteobacteria bacterium]
MKSPAIVFDAITVAPQADFAFDVWYANHYLPGLSARREFISVQRYGSPRRATYLAVLEASADASAIDSAAIPEPAHASITGVERYIAGKLGERKAPAVDDSIFDADILYPVFFRVPADRETEFNAWYEEEHLAILQRCPYWPACRRYRIRHPGTDSWTTEARSTPWRARLAQEPWFRGDYRVYYRYGQRRWLRDAAAQANPAR